MRQRRDRFDRFTDRARQVMAVAQEEARAFNHDYLGTEHLLLGLVRIEDGVAARVLRSYGADLARARAAVEFIIGRGQAAPDRELSLTPRAKRVLDFAGEEARRLSHGYIGTEHLLLGLLREGEGVGASIVTGELGIEPGQVRERIMQVIAGSGGPKSNVLTCRVDDRDLAAIDALVEAGIRSTRSDAAAWLIHAGVEAHQELFARVHATVEEIRRLRNETQAIASQIISRQGYAAAASPGDADPRRPDE